VRKVSKKAMKRSAIFSSAIAIAFIVGLFFFLGTYQFTKFFNEIFFVATLITITPPAISNLFYQRWMDAIEDQMPVLVRGIAESQETGITFIAAFEKVVENKMIRSPLAEEIKKLTDQMSWGLTFEEALEKFKERVGSPIVNRFCALVLEASHSGGHIRKVFTATSGFMEEMREMDQNTSSQMKPYLLIIYVAFYIFLLTSIILLGSFFAPLEGLQNLSNQTTIVGQNQFKEFYYRTMIVSAFLGGLMAGKIGERRVAGGLKHSIVMMVSGYIIFFLTIPPLWMVP
jgi:flagellar protein FlaJ